MSLGGCILWLRWHCCFTILSQFRIPAHFQLLLLLLPRLLQILEALNFIVLGFSFFLSSFLVCVYVCAYLLSKTYSATNTHFLLDISCIHFIPTTLCKCYKKLLIRDSSLISSSYMVQKLLWFLPFPWFWLLYFSFFFMPLIRLFFYLYSVVKEISMTCFLSQM